MAKDQWSSCHSYEQIKHLNALQNAQRNKTTRHQIFYIFFEIENVYNILLKIQHEDTNKVVHVYKISVT